MLRELEAVLAAKGAAREKLIEENFPAVIFCPPAEADPTGEHFAFEYGAAKQDGGQGFADVFKRGYFGWEYKGKHAHLDKAYGQLLQYRSDLQNPPLLVVCDMERIVIHTNFTNTVHSITTLALSDLLTADGLPEAKGQTYVLPAGTFFAIRDGKIARVTTYYNLADWIAQVGG